MMRSEVVFNVREKFRWVVYLLVEVCRACSVLRGT